MSNKLTDGLYVHRIDLDENNELKHYIDGSLADYAAMQHHYKECLEHGNTLEEAIELMEEKNGR